MAIIFKATPQEYQSVLATQQITRAGCTSDDRITTMKTLLRQQHGSDNNANSNNRIGRDNRDNGLFQEDRQCRGPAGGHYIAYFKCISTSLAMHEVDHALQNGQCCVSKSCRFSNKKVWIFL
jgi:hypothetical protein